MRAKDILEELRQLGSDGYKRILMNHGIPEPVYGVKVQELKKIQKRIGKDYDLALELYDSGVYDARYLAGLISDDAKMTNADLRNWATKACVPLAASTVAWVATGSAHGWELALEWIDSEQEVEAVAGWATLGDIVSVKADTELDLPQLKQLLKRVEQTIQQSPNHVRSAMNGFVISLGSYVAPLTALAIEAAEMIGAVHVDKGNTACKVPYAPDYIRKVQARGKIGKKRKTAKC